MSARNAAKQTLDILHVLAVIKVGSYKGLNRLCAQLTNWLESKLWPAIDAAIKKSNFKAAEIVKIVQHMPEGDITYATLNPSTV